MEIAISKKSVKKFIACLMAMLIMLSCVPVGAFAVDERIGDNKVTVGYTTENDINAGETKTIYISENDITYLKFTPEVSGVYEFYSSSENDTYGYLFDENKNEITYNDDREEDNNFSIVYDLEAGVTYYWGARYYNEENSGSFEVTLKKLCDHENTVTVDKQNPTCTEIGYTEGVCCEDCGEWIEGHELISARHKDEDADDICDDCEADLTSDIVPGETKLIEIVSEEVTYLKFIPKVSGTYEFFSSSGNDTYGYLFDAEKNEIARNDDYNDNDFSITYDLEAGVTYYWGARYYDEEDTGSFEVTLECIEVFCDHENATEHNAIDATCTENGYTEGVYCEDCKKWIEGHRFIGVRHKDEDADDICDDCETDLTSDIVPGETKLIEIVSEEVTYLKFIPKVSGTYEFFSSSSGDDTYGYLFDAEKNEIASNDDYNDNDFSITYDLEAGVTYYWGARYYDEEDSGSFNVTLEKLCDHKNTVSVDKQEPTCTENGYTEGVYCEDCKKWIEGHELIRAYHKDENDDNICDVCGNEAKNIIDDGNCGAYDGDNVTWVLYDDGELVISGEGNMKSCFEMEDIYSPFYYNDEICSVVIENGVTSIGSEMFYGCENLTSIVIPDSIEAIGFSAFMYCDKLEDISISNAIIATTAEAFEDTAYYNDDANWVDGVLYLGCNLIKAKSDISGTYSIKENTKTIAEYAFGGCENVEGIIIPDGVVSVGDYAFEGCSNIAEMIVPDSVTYLGSAFTNCTKMTRVRLPENIDTIWGSTFYNCTSLSDVTIPSSVTVIREEAFEGCESITSLVIPEDVTDIGFDAFAGCKKLVNIVIPDSVEEIGREAFYGCESLENVSLPGKLTSISVGLFDSCVNLKSVTIPRGVDWISYDAFCDCYNLKDVYFGGDEERWNLIENNSGNDYLFNATIHFYGGCTHKNKESKPQQDATCTADGYTAGEYCPDCEQWVSGHELIPASHKDDNADRICDACGEEAILAEGYWEEGGWKLYFDGTLEAYGEDCYVNSIPYKYQSFVREVVISDEMGGIGSLAFCNYTNLEKITIPDNVTHIGAYAFSGCESLESVVIPCGISEIYENTFTNCAKLEKIVIPEGVTLISTGAFSGCTGLKELYLPSTIESIYSYNFADENNLEVHFNGTEEQWEEVYIASTNVDLLNATIHFLDSACAHTNKTSYPQQDATCTADGYTAGEYCPDCEQWVSGHELIRAAHSWSDWTVTEATLLADGEKTRTCSACNETEKEVLAKLEGEVSVDESTGVSVEYTGEAYADKEMTINVVETSDAGSYLVENYENAVAWDIKTLVDGVEVQPDAPVLVTLPIPAGFDKNNIAVYHINPASGKAEKVEGITVEGDTVKFLAESFSVYVLVDEESVKYLAGRSLLFKDIIQIRYYFDFSRFGADVVSTGLLIWSEDEYKAMAVHDITTAPYKMTNLARRGNTDTYYGESAGIPAKNMIDNQYAIAYAELKDGTIEYTETCTFSPVVYCQTILAEGGNFEATMKNLAAALMNYGTAAQLHFKYKTDTLMNEWMSDELKAVAFDEALIQALPEIDDSKFTLTNDENIRKIGSSLTFVGNIMQNMYFDIENDDIANAREVKLLYWTESEYNKLDSLSYANARKSDLVYDETNSNKTGINCYRTVLEGVSAKDLRGAFMFAVYYKDAEGNEFYGPLFADGAHDYVRRVLITNTAATMKNLAKAFFMYHIAAEKHLLK